tara:strand:- start:134 stop:274 length:141 start_codon:yes stop_codon:yes gene_type:complete
MLPHASHSEIPRNLIVWASGTEAQSVCTRIEQACYRGFDLSALTNG